MGTCDKFNQEGQVADIGRAVRVSMAFGRLNPQRVADELGVSVSTVHRWRNQKTTSYNNLERVCALSGMLITDAMRFADDNYEAEKSDG